MENAPAFGHNNPPDPFDQLRERTAELIQNANRWINERGEVNAGTEPQAVDFANQLRQAFKDAEDMRKAEKQPHMDAAKAVDDKYATIKTLLETAGKRIKQMLTDYLNKKAAAEAEERRRLEAEAAAARKAAEELAAQAESGEGDVIGNTVQAEQAAKAAAEADKRAQQIGEGTKAHGAHAGRAMSLRTRRVGVIVDQGKVYRRYSKDALVIEALQKCVDRDVRSKDFGGSIPGVEVKEERSAA